MGLLVAEVMLLSVLTYRVYRRNIEFLLQAQNPKQQWGEYCSLKKLKSIIKKVILLCLISFFYFSLILLNYFSLVVQNLLVLCYFLDLLNTQDMKMQNLWSNNSMIGLLNLLLDVQKQWILLKRC